MIQQTNIGIKREKELLEIKNEELIKLLKGKDKEIERLNKIIEELKAILKSKGYQTYIPVLKGSDKE